MCSAHIQCMLRTRTVLSVHIQYMLRTRTVCFQYTYSICSEHIQCAFSTHVVYSRFIYILFSTGVQHNKSSLWRAHKFDELWVCTINISSFIFYPKSSDRLELAVLIVYNMQVIIILNT